MDQAQDIIDAKMRDNGKVVLRRDNSVKYSPALNRDRVAFSWRSCIVFDAVKRALCSQLSLETNPYLSCQPLNRSYVLRYTSSAASFNGRKSPIEKRNLQRQVVTQSGTVCSLFELSAPKMRGAGSTFRIADSPHRLDHAKDAAYDRRI